MILDSWDSPALSGPRDCQRDTAYSESIIKEAIEQNAKLCESYVETPECPDIRYLKSCNYMRCQPRSVEEMEGGVWSIPYN